ncbi:MAG: heavy metal translocating P-type ATPase metal-binding domain-containing protein, partial [Steroidobacter sp.]
MNAQPGMVEAMEHVSTDAVQSRCFHCNEPIPSGTCIYARIRQRDEAMCCEGCRAVAELIASAGLQDYYRYRNEPALKPEKTEDEWTLYAQPSMASQYVRDESRGKCSAIVLVDGIRCAACAWLIDRMLRRDEHVKDVNVNIATARVRVEWQGDQPYFSKILRALSSLGYKPHPLDARNIQQQADDERRAMLKRLGVSGVGMMQVMMYVLPMYVHSDMDGAVRHYLQLTGLLLTTPVLFYAGWPFLASAARTIKARMINMDVPVAIALLLAYGASVFNTLLQRGDTYFDSVCMFIFLLTLSRFVVTMVRHHSHSVADA